MSAWLCVNRFISFDESVQRFLGDFPNFPVELIETHLIAWLEMEFQKAKRDQKGDGFIFRTGSEYERAIVERNDSQLPGTGVCAWIRGVDAAEHRSKKRMKRTLV